MRWSAARVFAGVLVAIAAAGAQAAGMGADDARHLLNRTGFGAKPAEVELFASLERTAAIERLLAGARQVARTAPPEGVNDWIPPSRLRELEAEQRTAFLREQRQKALGLKQWWLGEMLATDSPLTERMTLFWHGHFTSSLQKVRSTALMHRQNQLLRRHALGNFADLLREVSRDPAMLVYLDSATSRRGQPSENFAREVMELFTLGEGHYSEQDIKEAARAFTGWSIDRDTGEFLWRPFTHDGGTKTVLGTTGELRGEQVIELLLAQPATAERIVRRLWLEFVSPEPDAAEVKRIAGAFRAGGYRIGDAMHGLLSSPAFWAQEHRGVLVKSPADLVVGTLREFEVGLDSTQPLVLLMRALGQDLLSPPNVKGWPGGEHWINAQTLLQRKQFLERISRMQEGRMSSAAQARLLLAEYQLK